jgi:iron(III) transport system substrate-binding protein
MNARHALRTAVAGVALALGVFGCGPSRAPALAPEATTAGATTTVFPARTAPARTLTIEAATDISFSRPFIEDFQRLHPDITVRYVDFISSALFEHAQRSCAEHRHTADIYLTVATDTLVKLANDGCAQKLPQRVIDSVPAWAQWNHSVMAFTLEAAVFIYNRQILAPSEAPQDHLQLIEMLRREPQRWRGRIGTYDITLSEMGYLYANADARQSATYGRLIESFGRSDIRTYCCSNEMAQAVARGDIAFAYNVQMSYAYAAQRRNPQIGIAMPTDYQAIQARSVMIPSGAGNVADAVAFASYLTSARGQALAGRQLAPLSGPPAWASPPPDRLLSPITVGPAMLAMADAARRTRFIAEWKRATAARASDPS